MKALIVYDSYFGNTQKVAESIFKTFGSKDNVSLKKADEIQLEQLKGLDLLIVGSPTRAFQPGEGMKKFLNSLPARSLNGVKVAAFDTRIKIEDTPVAILRFFSKIFGYAAKPMTAKLVNKGGNLVAPGEGFFVESTEGPLKDGELERAKAWAQTILVSK
jgi:flavodoxin I